VHEAHGLQRFPIKVIDVARDYSAQVYPRARITLVEGRAFNTRGSNAFEGALILKPDGSGEWGIFYNSAITSPGRINFTLAHELGHYLLHRALVGESIYCGKGDLWDWSSSYRQREVQANTFASYLLMPLDDFRAQVKGFRRPSVQDFEAIARRYAVSTTAAILKWLEITDRRAMIVISRDGFIDWSWSSEPLLRTKCHSAAGAIAGRIARHESGSIVRQSAG
jgi:IrrE N-terminal-like domain